MKAMSISKQCSICKVVKLLKDFHRNGSFNDGYNNNCKNCRNQLNKNLREFSHPMTKKEQFDFAMTERDEHELDISNEEREHDCREALRELTE